MFYIKVLIFMIIEIIVFGLISDVSDKFLRRVYAKNYVEVFAKKVKFTISLLDIVRLVILAIQLTILYLVYLIMFRVF